MPLTISTIAGGTRNCCSAWTSPLVLTRSKALLQSGSKSNRLPDLSSNAASISRRARNSASSAPP
eukprot:7625128-Pyramimonas_sp.AAC.1